MLHFEFEDTPESGASKEILPGLHWVRHSLPLELDHINVWLLFDDQHCAVVDTGMNSSSSRKTWQSVLEKTIPDRTLDDVVITHLHPDHVGLAGWLTREHQCPLHMTRQEYLLCRLLCGDTADDVPQEAIDFYRAAGVGETSLDRYRRVFGRFGRAVSALPLSYLRICEGDVMSIGGRQWQVLMGNGHSPEHACLFSEKDNVLISGDQILPNISSIVAVWPLEPNANPLADWLNSCRQLQLQIPEDVLVLPSHGRPFRGAHTRLKQLIEHHEGNLDKLAKHCEQPRRLVDMFEILFKRTIDDSTMMMAVGEACAHAHYLMSHGRIEKSRKDGVDWYCAVDTA